MFKYFGIYVLAIILAIVCVRINVNGPNNNLIVKNCEIKNKEKSKMFWYTLTKGKEDVRLLSVVGFPVWLSVMWLI